MLAGGMEKKNIKAQSIFILLQKSLKETNKKKLSTVVIRKMTLLEVSYV